MTTASQTQALCHARFSTDSDAESLCVRECSSSKTQDLVETCVVQHVQRMADVREVALHQLHVVIASSLVFGLVIIGMLVARRAWQRQRAPSGK